MPDTGFAQLEQVLERQGAGPALAHLVEHFRASGDYGRLFEARLMRKRHELGAPLTPSGPLHLDKAAAEAYDAEMLDAAREAARLYLDAGRIAEAWPYWRALGQPGPVREAIEQLPAEEATDEILEIALGERVHPLRGYDLLLERHGVCRAITLFDQYPDPATREDALWLLAARLHEDLRANLIAVIEREEGTAPDPLSGIEELTGGRHWLFGPYSYHIDISHLMSVVRMAAESARGDTVVMALELAGYGRLLSDELRQGSEAPFEDFFLDYSIYLRARCELGVEEAIAHFRRKVASYDYEQMGTYPAQTLVRMLVRLERPDEAVRVFEEFLSDTDPNYLNCPPLAVLCQMAGDYRKMRELAERDGDLIRYAAAAIAERGGRT